MAYAAKYKESGQIVLCCFGEAAVNQGIFHESLNMAQLWKLPIVYVCENNQYGMGTSQERAMSTRNIAKKADAFEMANAFVDGMDVMAYVRGRYTYYLAGIYAVIRQWHAQGKPRTNENRHDFQEWCQVLDWIVQYVLGEAPLFEQVDHLLHAGDG